MLPEAVNVANLAVSLVTLAGLAFGMGRLYGRIEGLEKGQAEIKGALFGAPGVDGTFVRKSEVELMLEAQNSRVEGIADKLERLGEVLEHARGSGRKTGASG